MYILIEKKSKMLKTNFLYFLFTINLVNKDYKRYGKISKIKIRRNQKQTIIGFLRATNYHLISEIFSHNYYTE